MKEEWLFPGAMVPVDMETTAALVAEIKRLIDVVGGMALAQRTWVGLTDKQIDEGLCRTHYAMQTSGAWRDGVEWAAKQLKEKNNG